MLVQGSLSSASSLTNPRCISKNKLRKVISVLLIASVTMLVINNIMIATLSHARRLRCRSRVENGSGLVNTAPNAKGDELRHLSKYDLFVDRLLEFDEFDENLCETTYPDDAVDEVSYTADSEEAQKEPSFTVGDNVTDEDGIVSDLRSEDGEVILTPDSDQDVTLDESERNLISSFESETKYVVPDDAEPSTKDQNTIAYVVPLCGCTEWYDPSGEDNTINEIEAIDEINGINETIKDINTTNIEQPPVLGSELYEASAVIKSQVCEMTEESAENRRLGKTQKLRKLDEIGQLSAAEMGYTMHALVHPMAVNCPIEGSSGKTYDRVKLLQSENYMVEILGHPVTEDDFAINNEYIKDNINNDVGIRDSAKLQAWNLDLHPVVVLMDYDSILQKPMDEEIDFLLADDKLKGLYILSPPDKNTGKAGVDTGFLIIKPSKKEFERIVHLYKTVQFNPQTGWNGFGFHNYKGDIGISGFLNWYFHNDPGYVELDRCIYAHNADDECLNNIPFSEAKHLKMYDHICGNARHCPYDHPDWSAEKREACTAIHRRYYGFRHKFEDEYFKKQYKSQRIGFFKRRSFLGYCRGPGKDGFLSMTGDVIEKPDWMAICPPGECPEGTFMTNACTCTAPDNPCEACPSNTICQTSPTLMCIDCDCGFCDVGGTQCCSNDGQTCGPGPGVNFSCNEGNDFFPAAAGYGHVCENIQYSKTAVPNGCGCKPTSHSPCTYNRDWGEQEEKCFICSASDLSTGRCESCKECLSHCPNSNNDCINTSFTMEDFMSCLGTITDTDCRSNCHFDCMKN